MTKNPGDWPDPQSQGYPKDVKKEWWHGLQFESGEIYCFWWRGSMWEHGNERYSPEMIAKMGVKYIGPCILQEETTAPLRDALKNLLSYAERNECHHENTHRGGIIWTICDDGGAKWADDQGGFKPYCEPVEITAARQALGEKEQTND